MITIIIAAIAGTILFVVARKCCSKKDKCCKEDASITTCTTSLSDEAIEDLKDGRAKKATKDEVAKVTRNRKASRGKDTTAPKKSKKKK